MQLYFIQQYLIFLPSHPLEIYTEHIFFSKHKISFWKEFRPVPLNASSSSNFGTSLATERGKNH